MELYHGTQKVHMASLIEGIQLARTTNLIESNNVSCFYTSSSSTEALKWATQGCEELTDFAAEENYSDQEVEKIIDVIAERYAIVVIDLDPSAEAHGVTTRTSGNTVMIFGEDDQINAHTQRVALPEQDLRVVIREMLNEFI